MTGPEMEGEGAPDTEFTGTAAFGGSGVVEVTVNVGDDINEVDYSLYGASNDNDPKSNTNPLKSEPGHPPSNLISGTGVYVPGQPYTIQITYSSSGPRVQTAVVRAGQAQSGNVVLLTFV